jgi:hypothetical protein
LINNFFDFWKDYNAAAKTTEQIALETWDACVNNFPKESVPLDGLVKPQKSGTNVIFYNEDNTKTVTFNFVEKGEEWEINMDFNPEIDMGKPNNELYLKLAIQFIELIKG